jgi:hypothetical protein
MYHTATHPSRRAHNNANADPEHDCCSQVELSVANVADALFQSHIYVDYVTASRVCVRPLDYLDFPTDVVHCFLDVVTATYAFDPHGVHAEAEENADLKECSELVGVSADDIKAAAAQVRRSGAFNASSYSLATNNGCHFVDAVLTVAGSDGVASYLPGFLLW